MTWFSPAVIKMPAVSGADPRGAASYCRTPYRIGSHERDELAPGLRSYHPIYSRQQAKHPHGPVKSPRRIVFYRVANDDVIEVVRLLHDAMELQLHLPND